MTDTDWKYKSGNYYSVDVSLKVETSSLSSLPLCSFYGINNIKVTEIEVQKSNASWLVTYIQSLSAQLIGPEKAFFQ